MELLDRSKLPEMQMTALPGALTAVKRGDGSVRSPRDWSGLAGKVAETLNDVVELNERAADDLVHPATETARVLGAAAQGDLSPSMAREVDDRPLEGEFLRTAKTINKMDLPILREIFGALKTGATVATGGRGKSFP